MTVGGEPLDQPKHESTKTSYDEAPHLHKTANADSVVWTRSSPWSKESGSVTTVKKQTKDAHGRYGKAVHIYTHEYLPNGSSVTIAHVRGTTTTYERERFSMPHQRVQLSTTRREKTWNALSSLIPKATQAREARAKPLTPAGFGLKDE